MHIDAMNVRDGRPSRKAFDLFQKHCETFHCGKTPDARPLTNCSWPRSHAPGASPGAEPIVDPPHPSRTGWSPFAVKQILRPRGNLWHVFLWWSWSSSVDLTRQEARSTQHVDVHDVHDYMLAMLACCRPHPCPTQGLRCYLLKASGEEMRFLLEDCAWHCLTAPSAPPGEAPKERSQRRFAGVWLRDASPWSGFGRFTLRVLRYCENGY